LIDLFGGCVQCRWSLCVYNLHFFFFFFFFFFIVLVLHLSFLGCVFSPFVVVVVVVLLLLDTFPTRMSTTSTHVCATTILAVLCVLFVYSPTTVVGDLPVHCLNTQVAGEWIFELGSDDNDKTLRCGHAVPDTNADHFTKDGFNLEVVKKVKITLSEPNIAEDEHGHKGTWTMVYDEGFEVMIDNKRYFAFSKYVPKTPESLQKDDLADYISICDETLVGWYHNDDGSNWGCYHAIKANAGSNRHRFRASIERSARMTHHDKVLSPTARQLGHTASGTSTVSLDDLENDALFEPDMAFIETTNSATDSTWRAGVHDEFLSKRMSEMMRLIGYRKRGHGHFRGPRRRRAAAQAAAAAQADDDSSSSDLPQSFDWRNHKGRNWDSPVKNQGNCGSCFAMATISVVEARIRIMTQGKHEPLMSTQSVVSCSIYNQGCDGGYPYLVGKHIQDFGLVPEACMPYSGTNERCEFQSSAGCPDPNNPPRVYAEKYEYIGGYYGGTTEELMMREIYNNGPIMIGFDAPASLFYYTGGVYTGPAAPTEGPTLPHLKPWEKTNHAVVAVGWGVTADGVKYWTIKNTWGKNWGEHGYFRIRRGTDECGVESMSTTLQLTLPKEYQA
jgi:cathepsin C